MKTLLIAILMFFPYAQAPKSQSHSATIAWVQGTLQAPGDCPVTNNKIYRGTVVNHVTLIATIPAATSYTDTKVQAGKTYYYKVSAVNCNGGSRLSGEVHATIPQ